MKRLKNIFIGLASCVVTALLVKVFTGIIVSTETVFLIAIATAWCMDGDES